MSVSIDIRKLSAQNASVYHDVPFHICTYCSTKLTNKQVTKDHIIPRSKGGRGALNLTASCSDCNQAKAELSLLDFLFYRPQDSKAARKFSTKKKRKKARRNPIQQEPFNSLRPSLYEMYKANPCSMVLSKATLEEFARM